MKIRYILAVILTLGITLSAAAQSKSSSSSAVRRGESRHGAKEITTPGITQRMQQHFEAAPRSDADLAWMRVIYRQLDLTKEANTPLYFPDEPMEGQDNLFRIILKRLADGDLVAYEYLDGREQFTDQYQIKVKDMLDRFHVLYTPAKGSTDKRPRFTIDESDIPASEVLTYYIIERWEFDNRSNRMRTVVDAICPVLHRSGDFGGEAVRYPMFWVKMSDLRPFLTTQTIFTSDDNNLATSTYDDYFQLGLYNGQIYKTRNLRNQSLMQQFPDPEDLAKAQDSIQHRLDSFGEKLWVADPPALTADSSAKKGKNKETANEEAATEETSAEATVTEGEETEAVKKENTRTKRGSSSKKAKPKKPKTVKSSSSSSATRSVRNRKRK